MKCFLLLSLFWLGGSQYAAAQTPPANSLHIKGRIVNYDGHYCTVRTYMADRIDTLRVRPDGSFDQTLTDWPGLQEATLTGSNFRMTGQWWAPGFDLIYQIVGAPKGTDFITTQYERLLQTKLTGYGSLLGNYTLLEDRTLYATRQHPKADAQAQFTRLRALSDSLWQATFPPKTQRQLTRKLPVFAEFARVKANERYFSYFRKWGYARTVDTATFNREFMTPTVYRRLQELDNRKCYECMLSAEMYVNELLSRQLKQGRPQGSNAFYALQLPGFGRLFPAPLAEYMRQDILREMVGNFTYEASPTAAEIMSLIDQYFPAGDEPAKGRLLNRFAEIQRRKATTRANLVQRAPAPDFQAQDSTGQVFSLASFKGKVVLIDFWASWCSPCRFEMPFSKRLYESYRTNPNVVFLSVAVHDKQANWQRALRQEKPAGLALWDHTGQANKAFQTSYIPRYALIGKQGELIDGYAPGPYLGEPELKKALDQALRE